jgi:hypothetical protein
VIRDFLHTCALSLSFMRRTQNRTRGIRIIEITITHKDVSVYGREVVETLLWLGELNYYVSTRLVVVFRSLLPRTHVRGNAMAVDKSGLGERLLQELPRERGVGKQAAGVSARPLEKEDFERHLEGLETYWRREEERRC